MAPVFLMRTWPDLRYIHGGLVQCGLISAPDHAHFLNVTVERKRAMTLSSHKGQLDSESSEDAGLRLPYSEM